MFYEGQHEGGFIIAPTATALCAYAEDGDSMLKTCEPLGGDGVTCIPGCSAVGEQCQEVGHDWSCSYGGADGLRLALQHQLERPSYLERNNEVVLSIDSVLGPSLPGSIEAIFYMADADDGLKAKARNVHAEFLQAFGLTREGGPPLVALDLAGGGSSPFSIGS